ncbi:MAG: prepilin-type N-terminal cleavage/methylation domain-containing protein [Filifactor alocis]|nr:prepilin-type N-terminal cleavage/methylation domain-containing protein [Filifactor alocis]
MRNRRGFVLMEVLIAIALFTLLVFYLAQASITSHRYIDQSLDRHRGQMIAEDALDTLQVEFQASSKINALVDVNGTTYTEVPEEEIKIKRLMLMQYKKVKVEKSEGNTNAKEGLKEFEQVITLHPEEERRPMRFSHRNSPDLSVSGVYEAATGVEELRIQKSGDKAYRLTVVAVAGKVKTEVSRILTLGKKR